MAKSDSQYDAVVVGSGPNGLAAAITLAKTGRSVLVIERNKTVGGGTRTQELTLPGFYHDVCSAVHPLALASPFFRSLDLASHGLHWIHPEVPLAHPMDDGKAVLLERSIEKTVMCLGSDAGRYIKFLEPFVRNWKKLIGDILGPISIPAHPFLAIRFLMAAMQSATGFAERQFKDERARALFAGNAAHSIMPLNSFSTASFGLMLALLGHAVGWPIARGGSQSIADALTSYFVSLGGDVDVEKPISSVEELPARRIMLFNVSPHLLASIATNKLPAGYMKRLESHKYGAGVFKVDWALDSPIPWSDRSCLRAGTVHIGGTMKEIAEAELQVWHGISPEKPFVLLTQPTLFDSERAPPGKHVAWAYCHVPNGSHVDMTERIENQVERFAPGFRNRILARSVMPPALMEEYNPNYVGGDIAGGIQDFFKLFVKPLGRWQPYSTPVDGLYICSSSMPPGAGVHGMCGYYAAKKAIKEVTD